MHSSTQDMHEGGGEERRVALHCKLLLENKLQHTLNCVVFPCSATAEDRTHNQVEQNTEKRRNYNISQPDIAIV